MDASSQQQQVAQAKQQVKEFIQMNGISPDFMVRIGQMATGCLRNKALYPLFREQVMNSGYFEDDDLTQRYNPTQLAVFATAGKMAKEMMSTGELGGQYGSV